MEIYRYKVKIYEESSRGVYRYFSLYDRIRVHGAPLLLQFLRDEFKRQIRKVESDCRIYGIFL